MMLALEKARYIDIIGILRNVAQHDRCGLRLCDPELLWTHRYSDWSEHQRYDKWN